MNVSAKCILGASALIIPSMAFAKSGEKPKKVVLIAVDDLNDWVGFLGGHPNTITPNMDRLAAMGVVFENAYCAAPVSNPSRAAMMSGLRPSSSGVYGNMHLMRDSEPINEVLTIPQYFSANGYLSMHKGKIFHEPTGIWSDPESWDIQEPYELGGLRPAAKVDGVNLNGIPETLIDWAPVASELEDTSDYFNCDWAAKQILKEHDQPVFIGCGVFRPHIPWYVPQKYYDMHPLDSIEDPLYNEFDVLDLPESGKANTAYQKGPESMHGYKAILAAGKDKEAIQAYLACITYADACIGVVVDALEKNPDRDNTIIILYGDHGWHLGEKMRYSKTSLWDRSCRIPMIMIAPGVAKPGTRCTEPVSLVDVYPTLVELASLPKNSDNEGNSFVAQLKNPNKKRSVPAITTSYQNVHSLCDGRYRYIVYANGDEELYDHKHDPMEWYNIADKREYDGVKERLGRFIPTVNADPIPKAKVHEKYIMQ